LLTKGNAMNEILDHQILRQNAFGVVDAAMVEHLPKGVIAEALVPSVLASSAHLMPRLIDLRHAPDDQLHALLDCLRDAHESGQPPPVAVLVRTNASAREFARHWNSMQVVAPHPKRKVWLRLHDPRVLHQLLRILTPMQRRKLFGRSEAFTYWVGEEWVSATAEGSTAPNNGAAERGVALLYAGTTRWDWTRIELIGIINRALHGAGMRQAAALTSHGALAEQLIERANTHYGLRDHADMVEFAVRGLTTSDTFDEHPDVARVIKPSSHPGEESSLSDRLALLDEHIWNELRQPA
jgi:hypothetical protein